ncbi:hypothetical protein ABZY44_36550, partial [Streptomyces sp. NPDC006544]
LIVLTTGFRQADSIASLVVVVLMVKAGSAGLGFAEPGPALRAGVLRCAAAYSGSAALHPSGPASGP